MRMLGATMDDYAFHGVSFMSRTNEMLNRPAVRVFALMLMALSLFAGSAFAANANLSQDTFGSAMDAETSCAACGFAKALKGPIGWLIIGFGMLLAVWDYFVQKQGHLIVMAIVGILVVIILGRAIWSGANCGSIGPSGYEQRCNNGTSGGVSQ